MPSGTLRRSPSVIVTPKGWAKEKEKEREIERENKK